MNKVITSIATKSMHSALMTGVQKDGYQNLHR